MEPNTICNTCGEKNRPYFKYCGKCGAKLSFRKKKLPTSLSSTSKRKNIKICPKCHVPVNQVSKFCSKCGQSLQQEPDLPPRTQVKLPITFTSERASLERAIQSFDGIFTDQTFQSVPNQVVWNKKKQTFLSQKERFLEKKISNEVFYIHLKRLNEYIQSIGITQEEGLLVESQIFETSRKKVEIELEAKIPEKKGKTVVKPSHLVEPAVVSESEPIKGEITPILPVEPVSEEIRSLFQSIQYQVQDIIFEQGDVGPIVRIIPYSGSIKEITTEFEKNQIIMRGYLKRQNILKVDLELKIDGEPRIPSWDDFWKDITLLGEEKLIKQIKLRNEIANRLNSLGTALVKVESSNKGEIFIQLICNKAEKAIKHAYSLIKDLQLLFEISFY